MRSRTAARTRSLTCLSLNLVLLRREDSETLKGGYAVSTISVNDTLRRMKTYMAFVLTFIAIPNIIVSDRMQHPLDVHLCSPLFYITAFYGLLSVCRSPWARVFSGQLLEYTYTYILEYIYRVIFTPPFLGSRYGLCLCGCCSAGLPIRTSLAMHTYRPLNTQLTHPQTHQATGNSM